MQLNSNNISFTFALKDIIIPHYSLNIPFNFVPPTSPAEQLPIEIGTGIIFDEDNKAIVINLHIKIFSDSKKEILLCDLITQTIYEISNFSEIIHKKAESEFDAPDLVVHTLIGIALSTTRGILMEKNAGNFLNKVFIPIVKPADLFKQA